IGGRQSVTSVAQDQVDWLDVSPYQDLFFWLDVREVNRLAIVMKYETSPIEDESYFVPLVAGTALSAATAPARTAGLLNSATVAPAKWVRWRLAVTTTGSWDVTFRILVAANSPGA